MSANHTRLDKSTYEANIRELIRLENSQGNVQAVRHRIQRSVDRIDSNTHQLQQQAQSHRARILKKIRDIEYENRRSFKEADSRILRDSEKVQSVQTQTQKLKEECQAILASLHSMSGATLMAQTKLDFQMCENDPDYKKFASLQMAALSAKIQEADRLDQNPATILQAAIRLTGEIYALDLAVSAARQKFELLQLESVGNAESVKEKINNARANIHYGDSSTDLVNFDYWTDGQLGLVEKELDEIARRLDEKRYDPSYCYEELEKDHARIEELDRIQLLLVQDAIEKSALSEARESMGGIIAEILRNKHYFEVIGSGFEGNDLRESFIMRLRRGDGAEIEVIINPNYQNGENDLYYRINMNSYVDEGLMRTIQLSIEEELREYGIQTTAKSPCSAEVLEPYDGAVPQVSEETRRRHNIRKRPKVQVV